MSMTPGSISDRNLFTALYVAALSIKTVVWKELSLLCPKCSLLHFLLTSPVKSRINPKRIFH